MKMLNSRYGATFSQGRERADGPSALQPWGSCSCLPCSIEADRDHSLKNLMRSSALATVFVPKLGYARVSKLVHASVSEGRIFIDLVVEQGLMTHNEVLVALRECTDYREG